MSNKTATMPKNKFKQWWENTGESEQTKPLMSHLNALRMTLFICVAAIIIGFSFVFFLYSEQLVQYVIAPLKNKGIEVIFTDVAEGFGAQTKLSFIAGVVLASPVITLAIWVFIRPALKKAERMRAGLVFFSAIVLFVIGVCFAYYYVLNLAVTFFLRAGSTLANPLLSLGTYINFMLGFLLPFGIMFELPIIVVWLTRIGLISPTEISKMRKYVIFVIFIIAAILTPPDVVSQAMLGLPMCVLFEVGVIASKVASKKREID